MGDPGTERYRFAVTGYAGFEGEILRLRNANRPHAQTARYLDWRYTGSNVAPAPKVYWMKDAAGRCSAMAALIFRSFWIGNEPRHVAVLGDISLDSDLRGRGLGRSLLEFVAEDLERHQPDCLGFVVPSEEAERSLACAGWTTGGRLIPHVLMLDAAEKLRRVLKSQLLARGIARPAGMLMAGVTRLHRRQGTSLRLLDRPEDSLDAIWRRFDRRQFVLSDRSIATLQWRYASHPQAAFKFAVLLRHGQPAGYLVYEVPEGSRECSIYDLLLPQPADLGSMLALFARHLADAGGVDAIRLLLNDGHPYRRQLWKLGFVARASSGVFQLYGRNARARLEGCRWFLTYGDKDV
jgi:GNAT superfamily N-acetyltransferase